MVNTVLAVYFPIPPRNDQHLAAPDSGPKLRRNWLQLDASRTRSSSSCRYLSNSATTLAASAGRRHLGVDNYAPPRAAWRQVLFDDVEHARTQHFEPPPRRPSCSNGEVHLGDRGKPPDRRRTGRNQLSRRRAQPPRCCSRLRRQMASRDPAAAASSSWRYRPAESGRDASTDLSGT